MCNLLHLPFYSFSVIHLGKLEIRRRRTNRQASRLYSGVSIAAMLESYQVEMDFR